MNIPFGKNLNIPDVFGRLQAACSVPSYSYFIYVR